MTFAKSDLKKVARLARLALTEEEIERFVGDLDRIVSYVAQLEEVDVDGIEPMSHAGRKTLLLREDISKSPLGRECVSSSAGYEEGLIRVPKIIE